MTMQPQIMFGAWVTGDSRDGGFAIPFELVGSDVPEDAASIEDVSTSELEGMLGEVTNLEVQVGYGVRLHMPGYLDSTGWTFFETEADANYHLEEMWDFVIVGDHAYRLKGDPHDVTAAAEWLVKQEVEGFIIAMMEEPGGAEDVLLNGHKGYAEYSVEDIIGRLVEGDYVDALDTSDILEEYPIR